MEDTITGSSQWVQSCDSFHSPLPFSDATALTTGLHSTLVSPNNSRRAIEHHQHQLSPKSSGCVTKPIRRRSRASKRTPATLLNANTTNFRSLVQQFTGCPRATISFATQKGHFGAGSAHTHGSSTNFPDNFYHQLSQQGNWSQQNEQQQYQQQQQHYYSREQILDHVSKDDACNSVSPNVEIKDDFVLDDFSLDALTRDYLFSN